MGILLLREAILSFVETLDLPKLNLQELVLLFFGFIIFISDFILMFFNLI